MERFDEFVCCFTWPRRFTASVDRPDAAADRQSQITNVALDSITHSLDASATQLELIVALYGVSFAVCSAMGSKLGDNYGRRRLFMWGRAFWPRLFAVRHGQLHRRATGGPHAAGGRRGADRAANPHYPCM